MRKILLTSILAFSLAGCATTGSTISPNAADIIAQIQSGARTACSFVPTATTIANLLASGPSLSKIEDVIAIICGVVAGPQPASQLRMSTGRARAPQAHGVPIHGIFTDGRRL